MGDENGRWGEFYCREKWFALGGGVIVFENGRFEEWCCVA